MIKLFRNLASRHLTAVIFLLPTAAFAAPLSHEIKVDHFGYRPADTKISIISANPGSEVEIRNAADAVVFRVPQDGGSIQSKGNDGASSGDDVWWVDFSALNAPGTYRVYSAALSGQSYDFEIREDIYNDVVLTALRSFYLQRCNTPKLAIHAGDYADPAACHLQDLSTGPAAGHIDRGMIDLTGGWHDAGDYNKYVWGAVSTAILNMLRAYEDNPDVFRDGDLNIPESGNGVVDILDEIKWELDWLMKMQLPDGSVLYQMHVDGFASDAPPSVDGNVRFYQDPNVESASVFAGTLSHASQVFAGAGMNSYANALRSAAVAAWNWLLGQSEAREEKAWAAAELFASDSSLTSARDYVDNFYPSQWAGRFFNPARYDSHAAITYIQATGATASVVNNMRASVGAQVDYIFSTNDLYRNGLPDWAYHWGSNIPRASTGIFLHQAVKLGETGSHPVAETLEHAQDFLHFFHGQNPINMLYLSNMSALGGEHSSWQFYHSWFGFSDNVYSSTNFMGKPAAVNEPDYPYFKGTDNHGVNDNKTSLLGPAPGFVPGGPNKDYSGDAIPPGDAVFYNRYYRDWADQAVWTARTWEITENSIGYQGAYVALGTYYMTIPLEQCSIDADCDDGAFCNGAETCVAGSCVNGNDPCPGTGCDELIDQCIVNNCNNDGICDALESCEDCASDCVLGNPASCGNGVCETADGEDCLSCVQDCAGRQNGNPRNRYCCGLDTPCEDGRCTANGFQCSSVEQGQTCCGDGTCSGLENSMVCEKDCGPAPYCGDLICNNGETPCSCSEDCGAPPGSEVLSCNDNIDNDCDSLADCDDADCFSDAACQAPECDNDGTCEPGEDCLSCGSDCAGRQNGKPSGRFCCGDGILQDAEGAGAICDNNF
jgi:endoglucanase